MNSLVHNSKLQTLRTSSMGAFVRVYSRCWILLFLSKLGGSISDSFYINRCCLYPVFQLYLDWKIFPLFKATAPRLHGNSLSYADTSGFWIIWTPCFPINPDNRGLTVDLLLDETSKKIWRLKMAQISGYTWRGLQNFFQTEGPLFEKSEIRKFWHEEEWQGMTGIEKGNEGGAEEKNQRFSIVLEAWKIFGKRRWVILEDWQKTSRKKWFSGGRDKADGGDKSWI